MALDQEPPAYDSRCPFPGLLAFGSRFATSGKSEDDDRDFFFGREKLVAELVDKLRAHPFLAVVGGSGSGKSSLVLAGLVPALEKRVAYMTPGSDPHARLDAALGTGASVGQPAGRDASPLSGLDQPPPILVVDQFEELFRLTQDGNTRQAFVHRLLALTKQHFVVLTMRADFWGDCAPYPALKDAMLAHQVLIAPMTSAELRSAMEQQAAAVGLRFEADLSNTILDAVEGEPGAMPLLQHLLLEMWNRRHGRWLRASEYRALGEIQQAIAHTADGIYAAWSPAEQATMRNIFMRLTRLDEGLTPGLERRNTRRRAAFADLVPAGQDPSSVRALVHQLADARLVVVSPSEEVEVAHEALIRHWPRLLGWLQDARRGLQMREAVRQAADEWHSKGRDDGYIAHRGNKLKDVETAIAKAELSLNDLESSYLQACRTAEQKDMLREMTNLAKTGWGVIFAADADHRVQEALGELLTYRAAKAKERYRVFAGEKDGYRPGDSTRVFLARHGVGSGAVSSDQMPRYLMIVGDPESIPYSFQYQLSTQFAVGRICFQEVEEYSQYAHSVVSAETERTLPPRAVMFAPQHANDTATLIAQRELIEPLLARLTLIDQPWTVETVIHEDATKERLSQILSAETAPALIFTVSHSMNLRSGSAQQRAEQGALICQNWPGPQSRSLPVGMHGDYVVGTLYRDFCFTADDIPQMADLRGMIAFIFTDFGAGTPSTGDFDFFTRFGQRKPESQAPQSFVARLPQKLLSHPRGGALAAIGHVDRAWTSSFAGELGELEVIATFLRQLMAGYPVGIAAEGFTKRYAALTSELVSEMLPALLSGEASLGRGSQNEFLSKMVAAYDARNWVIIGDPAVRLVTA